MASLRRLLLVCAAALLLAAAPARAASPGAVAAVGGQLHAPSCPPNFSVADCPTDEARLMRQRIGTLLDQGLTPDQVVAVFVHDYGPQVRYVPPRRGAGLITWLLPGFAVLVGAAVCLLFIRRHQSPTGPPPAEEPPAGEEGAAPPSTEAGDDPVLAERLKDYL